MSEKPEVTLTDGSPVTEDKREINTLTGMQKGYVVLSEAERAKGFVRPVRTSYIHLGQRPKYPVRDLTEEEKARYNQYGYVKYEKYPEDHSLSGRFWTQDQLNSGCYNVTTMGISLAETYARDPNFYSGTFCATCGKHFPVEQFIWEDGTTVGS
jgi:hypothetical protein